MRALALLALTACSGLELIDLERLPDPNAKAAVIALGPPGAPFVPDVFYAFDVGMPFVIPAMYERADSVHFEALLYAESLGELGLEAAELVPTSDGFTLSAPAAIFERDYRAGDRGAWSARAAAGAWYDELEFPKGIDPAHCVERGGCFLDDRFDHCKLECPEPDPVDAPHPPEPPMPAERAVLMPCPSGWSVERGDEALPDSCRPWPARAAPFCGMGELALPSSGCRELGTPCGASRWPANVPAGAVYVDSEAALPGDGSIAAPYATLAQALADTATVVALSKGEHFVLDDMTLGRAIELRGACAAETELQVVQPSVAPMFNVLASGVRIADLTLSSARVGVAVAGGSAELSGLWVLDTEVCAIAANEGASVTATDVYTDLSGSTGFFVHGGSSMTARGVVMNGPSPAAIVLADPATMLELSDFAIRGQQRTPTLGAASAISLAGGAHASVREGVIEGGGFGVVVKDEGSSAAVEAVLIRDPEQMDVFAVSVQTHGRLEMRKSAVRATGMHVDTATLSLSHVMIAGYFDDPSPATGIIATAAHVRGDHVLVGYVEKEALWAHAASFVELEDLSVYRIHGPTTIYVQGATLALDRARIEHGTADGVFVEQDGASARISDLVMYAEPDTSRQTCALVKEEASLSIARATLEDCGLWGVFAFRADGLTSRTIRLSDLDIARLDRAPPDARGAPGISITTAGVFEPMPRAEITRVRVTATQAGVFFQSVDAKIEDLELHPTNWHGFEMFQGGRIDGKRISIDGALGNGMKIAGYEVRAEGEVDFEQLSIRGTQCIMDDDVCANESGAGFLVVHAAHATVRNFAIETSQRAGVRLDDGQVDLFDGRVTGNDPGAEINTVFDVRRLATRVRFENELDLVIAPPPP